MGEAVGGLCPSGVQSKAPGQVVRGREADDDLLIQQQNFCAHSYVYAEIQLN